ncbi:MAG TPA: UDP-N-acetylmuramoyl-tripeptide--D-alanyl-D-alanine ligase [Candidatus Nanopelagicales bacterium]|nr:UDP-N-acetylmuramoyl-tripeptide--D-alanyl-D-alanine ligase [Candidatus Nanopelagicales bacterium]
MREISLVEVAEAVGGRLLDQNGAATPVTAVVTDSRLASPGSLFVAIAGDRTDGHQHADQAFSAGAVAVLAERPLAGPTILVADTVVAVGRLAAHQLDVLRGSGRPEVIGITGSVGKTSTKDLLAQLLEGMGQTVYPPGSFNNDLGLPMTVLRCDEQTRYLLLEYGARGLGHIRRLTEVASPQVGVVLGVGTSHLGEFGSVEAIAQAKSELVAALPAAEDGGVAVLNADDPRVTAMERRTTARVRTFGLGPGADVRASAVTLDDDARPSFRLHAAGDSAPVSLQLLGEPAVMHALATAAVALELGCPLDVVAAGLGSAVARSSGRLALTETPDGVGVLDDTYNASPESMAAGLRTLVRLAAGRGVTIRTWAVLGEMRELGASSVTEHLRVGRLATELGVDRVVAVGEAARAIQRGALDAGMGAEAVLVPDAATATAVLREQARSGDLVLVKASRAVGLERVVAALMDPAGRS